MTGKVLLIDDDPAIAKTLQMLLRTRGWEADVVHTGAEGVAAAVAERAGYALAVVDFRLPDCDGLEVVTQVREHASQLPMVLMSGYGPEEFSDDPRAKSAKAIFRKPVPLDDLCALLEELTTE